MCVGDEREFGHKVHEGVGVFSSSDSVFYDDSSAEVGVVVDHLFCFFSFFGVEFFCCEVVKDFCCFLLDAEEYFSEDDVEFFCRGFCDVLYDADIFLDFNKFKAEKGLVDDLFYCFYLGRVCVAEKYSVVSFSVVLV